MNGYKLSRAWFDFAIENPELIRPSHGILYFFAIEHCNRLGWKEKFGLPTDYTMAHIGIKNYKTYMNVFNDLIDFGFFKIIQRSKNQYTTNIIALVYFTKAPTKVPTKASTKAYPKQVQSIVSIDKPITNKPLLTIKKVGYDNPPTLKEIEIYFLKKIDNSKNEAEKFFKYNDALGWKNKGQKIKNWQSIADLWLLSEEKYKKEKSFGKNEKIIDYEAEKLKDPRLKA